MSLCHPVSNALLMANVHVQVLEAAVIAIPHPKWTERPLLVVVKDPKANLTKEDMLKFLQVWCRLLPLPW